MTTTKKYDFLNRLLDITSVPSASSAVKFAYQYNDANQRTRRADSDDSYWSYEYDALGQVTSGKHYWPDATPVAGQQFDYVYDDIGNRRWTKEGGDAAGSGLRTANYSVNNLNQYTQRDVPGAADIIGIAYPFAPVTVNDQSTSRRGEYYHKELAIENSSAPVWQSVTNQATYTPSATNTEIGNLLLPKTPQSFWYDSDGNTLSDFVWTNGWDAENRMVVTENTTSVPTSARLKETWMFDDEGRWVQRIRFSWNGSTYVPQYTNRLIWNGKLLAAILDQNNTLAISLLRRMDLGGSSQDAGGVGGLIAINLQTNSVHFCAFDANGNVTHLVGATDGSISGIYDFDPFANLIRVNSAAGKSNPIRFSTQFADEVLGSVKYLYRDYAPSSGRWLNRDPIHDPASSPSRIRSSLSRRQPDAFGYDKGLNLYAFVMNAPSVQVDPFGTGSCCECTAQPNPAFCAPPQWEPGCPPGDWNPPQTLFVSFRCWKKRGFWNAIGCCLVDCTRVPLGQSRQQGCVYDCIWQWTQFEGFCMWIFVSTSVVSDTCE